MITASTLEVAIGFIAPLVVITIEFYPAPRLSSIDKAATPD
jgi:hypothetical protein